MSAGTTIRWSLSISRLRRCNGSPSRSAAATRIPLSRNARTSARPMPPAAPVTITVLPSRLIPLPLALLKRRHHLAGEQPHRLQRLVPRDVAKGKAAEHVIDPAFLDLAREGRADFLWR